MIQFQKVIDKDSGYEKCAVCKADNPQNKTELLENTTTVKSYNKVCFIFSAPPRTGEKDCWKTDYLSNVASS